MNTGRLMSMAFRMVHVFALELLATVLLVVVVVVEV